MDFRNSPLLRRMALSGGFRVLALLVAAVVGLVLAPYMFDKLGANDCGLMVVVATIISMIGMLDAGLNAAISRHVAAAFGAEDNDRLHRCFNSGFFLFCGVGLTAILITLLIAWKIEAAIEFIQRARETLHLNSGPQVLDTASVEKFQRNIALMRILLVILSFQFAVELLLRSLVGVVSGSLRADIVSMAVLILRIIRPTVSFLILYWGGGVISLTVAGCVITFALFPFWYCVIRRLVPTLRLSWRYVDLETVKSLYKFSFFAFLSFLSRNFHTSMAVIILSSMYGLDVVAVYSMICVTLYTYGADVSSMLSQYLSPIFAHLGARKESETMRKTVFFAIKVSTGAAVFVTFGLIAWGHPFIERWMCGTDPGRIAAYLPLAVMSLIILFEQSQAPTVELLYGTATHRYYALVNIVEAGIAILLFPFLAWRFQMLGIAVGLLVAAVVARLVLQPFFVCKVLEIRRSAYFSLLGGLAIKGAAALVLPMIVTLLLVQSNYPRLILVGALSVLFYGPVFVGLAFTKDERDLVFNALFKRRSAIDG